MRKYDDDDVEDYDEYARNDCHDEYDAMKCIMMSCDWNSLLANFGKLRSSCYAAGFPQNL